MVDKKELLRQGWQMFRGEGSRERLFLFRDEGLGIVRVKLSDGREGMVSLEYADQFADLIDEGCPTCGSGSLGIIFVDLNIRLQLACTRCQKLHIPVEGEAVLCAD